VDRSARFRALFAEAYPPMRRWAHHRGLAGADADDVVAEVFTIAWRRFDDIPADAAIPWLYGVARNVLRNHRRSDARRGALQLVVPPAVPVGPPLEPADPDAAMLRRALDALGDDDREILRLVAWDGLDPSEAAIVLDCSAATARVRLFRARKRFALSLDAVTHAQGQTRSERERSLLQEVPDVR
jgi:RNA polymerase sigma-70 factor (ECF subfamily)